MALKSYSLYKQRLDSGSPRGDLGATVLSRCARIQETLCFYMEPVARIPEEGPAPGPYAIAERNCKKLVSKGREAVCTSQ
jgi:hypothetical protein